jgi:predicted nucleic acid-binding protein
MPVLRYLLDTNLLSEAWRLPRSDPLNSWLNHYKDECAVPSITVGEIKRGIDLKPDGRTKRQLEKDFADALTDYRDVILPFDYQAAMEWGRYVATQEKAGRRLGRHDSQIAAIALAQHLTVVTRNTRDFPDVRTLNPPQTAAS